MSRKKLDETLMEEVKEHKYKWYEFGCKDASYLTIKADFSKLSLSEKALLKFHLATCKYCRRFVKQMTIIDTLLKAGFEKNTLKLAPQKKVAINQLITKNLTKS